MAIKTGYFTGTQTVNGTDVSVQPEEELDLSDSQDFDSNFYSWAGGSPDDITIQQAGDYLVALNVPIDFVNVPNAERQNFTVRVRVNGTPAAVGKGQSGYLRDDTFNHGESSVHLYTYLNNLNVNDVVDFTIIAEGFDGTANIDGKFWAYIEEVTSETIFFATTDTYGGGNTDFNGIAESTLDWDEVRKDTGYTHTAASGTITLDNASDYMILINVPFESTDADDVRQNWIGRVKLQGAEVNGGRMAQGYIRNFDNCNQSSLHWCGLLTTANPNEDLTVTVQYETDASTSAVTIPNSLASIYIQEVDTTTVPVFKGRGNTLEGGVNDWNTNNSVEWTANPIKDTDTYTHDTGTNPHLITLNNSGNYLALFNVSLTSVQTRPNPDAQGKYNGVLLDGVKSSSSYIRDNGNHNQSSLSFMAPLHNITGGNNFEVEMQNDPEGLVDDSNDAMLVLIEKDISGGSSFSNTTEETVGVVDSTASSVLAIFQQVLSEIMKVGRERL